MLISVFKFMTVGLKRFLRSERIRIFFYGFLKKVDERLCSLIVKWDLFPSVCWDVY